MQDRRLKDKNYKQKFQIKREEKNENKLNFDKF